MGWISDGNERALAGGEASIAAAAGVRQWPIVLAGMAIFVALSATAGIRSEGFLEADGCVHYEYARFALEEHHLFTNVWGRPFCTAIYCIPANLGGLVGVRLASLAMALAIGVITWRIAKNQGYLWPGLALLFLIGQPIVFLHSFSELTELPFALLLALGFWAYQARRWLWMAVFAALLPTARPEGFGFLMMAAVALVLHRRARYLPVLVAPLMAWSAAGWYYDLCRPRPWYSGIATWLPRNWPYSAESVYGRGFVGRFVVLLPAIVSPAAFPAVMLGAWRSFGMKQGPGIISRCFDAIFGDDHRVRVQWMIALIPLMVLAGHSVLYATGRMASSGELRYMTVAAPMWALLAALGWEWLFVRLKWRRPMTWALVGLVVPVLANVFYRVVPLKMDDDWVRGGEVVRWYRSSPYRENYPLLIAPHPAVKYYQGVSPANKDVSPEWNHDTANRPPNGAIFVWDPMYANYNSDARRIVSLEEIEKAGWVRVHTFAKVYKEEARPGRIGMAIFHVKRAVMGMLGREVDDPRLRPAKLVVGEWYVYLSPVDVNGRKTERGMREAGKGE